MWSRIRKSSVVFGGAPRFAAAPPKSWRWTSKTVRSSDMFDASARPRSFDHTLTITTSQSASARSDDWRSKVLPPSPDSMLSVPCRSSTSVLFALVLSHAPLVVCDRPCAESITANGVPNSWFISVLLPLDCGPMIETTAKFAASAARPLLCAMKCSSERSASSAAASSPR